MIKKLRYLCTLLLIAVASAAWGEEVVFYTLDTTGSLTGSNNGYANNCDIESDGITWNFTGNSQMNPWRIGGKSLTEVDRTVYTKTAMGSAISKIVLTLGTGADVTINSLKLIVASDASFSQVLDEITRSEVTLSGDNVFTPTSGTEWATGAYYKFTFNLTIASDKNKFIQFSKVTFFKEKTSDSKKDATVTIGSTTINKGETTEVTTDGPTLSLSTSDATVASVSGTIVTGVAAGTATITATWDEYDEFLGGTKAFTVTVVDPNAPGTEGNPYTVDQAIEAINALADGGYSDSEVYVSGIISGIKSLDVSQWERAQYFISDDGTEDNQLLVYNGYYLEGKPFTANDQIKAGDEVVVFGKLQKYVKDQVVTPEIAQNNKIVSLNRPSGKASAELSFTPATASVELGGEFTTPTLNNPHELTVTYSSSNEDVATVVASTGDVSILAIGETTITATFAGNDEYEEGFASYTLTVTDPNAAGSSTNPYTVAEARAAIDAGDGVTGVYAKGKVSKIVTAYNADYGNISYNISDDGTETAAQLQAYRGKSYNGENFTSADDIKVGDEVVVFGNLKKHNSTYEFDAGNQLVSLTRPETPVTLPVPSFSPAAGEVEAGTTVKINIEEDENVDYVLYKINDGEWQEYSDETVITITEETIIYARAIGVDESEGEIASAKYTIKAVTPAQDVVIVEDGKTTFLFNTEGNEWGFPVGSSNKIVEETSYTANNVTIKVAGSKGNGFYYPTGTEKYLLMGKSGAYLTLPAFDFEVGKIEVVGASGASESVKQNIYVGDNAVSTETTGAKNVTNKYVIDADYRAAGNVYTLKVTNNYNTQISQIIVHKATGAEKADPQLKYSAATATATLGSEFAAPTLSYVDGFDGTVVYESSDERVATVDAEGNVTLVAAGETTIKATSAETDNYLPGEAFYTLTVKEPAVVGDNKYELVTDASTLKAGDEILIAYVGDDGATVMGKEQKKANRAAVAATLNDDKTITPNSDAQIIKLEGGWYFNVGNGYLYASSSNANELKTETEKDENAMATISIAKNENTEAIETTVTFQGTNTRNVMRFNPNNGTPLFACYLPSSTTGFLPQIYRKVTSTETLLGDVNGDKKVDIADVTKLVNLLLNESERPTPEDLPAANVDGNDVLDAADVEALVQKILSNQ